MNVPFFDVHRLHGDARAAILAAFERVLDSGRYVQGTEVEDFEREFAEASGARHAIAVANGTVALHVALVAAGVKPGDEVILPANTFIATAEAVAMAGARPVFTEIDGHTLNLDPVDVEARITPRTTAIIAVHLYGRIAPMAELEAVARRHALLLIEDACQAHGATLDGKSAGTIGDVGCLSFYPTKNLGAIGEGGMVLTADPVVAARIAALRDHGQIDRHHHLEVGYNYRMSELQAAALRVLLPMLPDWNARRIAAAAHYDASLAGTDVVPPAAGGPGEHVYHLYVVRSRERDALQRYLQTRGIGTAIHYPRPIHLQPAFRRASGGPGSLRRTERVVDEILSLPMHPGITAFEIETVCRAVQEFAGPAAGREPIPLRGVR